MEAFVKYLQEASSIEKVENEKLYEKYIKGTLQLNDYKKNDLLIQDLVENENIVGRKFYNKNGNISYEERFISNEIYVFTQISKNVTFLFPPEINKINAIIGYRFFNSNPKIINKETSYFTLVLKYKRKFEILEKHSTIFDINGNTFINKNLNCLNIIINIIKRKI